MNESTNTNTDPDVEVKQVNPEVLLDIWLDGFASGVATLIMNASEGHDDAPPEEVQATIVEKIIRDISADPAAMETARQKIYARLLGRPQFGTTTLTVVPLNRDNLG
ncbi:hypothetical protein [Mycobacteroides abscessus]|uniref:hypothetical protein n=1 Tax=Mycobacteroides abscessus TaxID=36809 RepID=UPI0009264C61|nr:hypothetical protein [Mycobacteroides abscessus]DAZ90212.1 TPA_asm: hypothetical protein PROPHIFSIL01-1_25 [Mycobacterium phage prophiFSIL01-1]SHZ91541.1 Uncharacterised protein [Mycobacteroides abscessus subsp. abscessus]SIA08405.1 Uncharacterised protein [Mycobacteroides abscessus subsp. abscessus]SIA66117.1 Uncharacterised protein [Mycobacteroides abscessus subsp. abscessus]SIA71293.1 Uncharacterised protein [Mycobacteroides abscessus subsp. abscessus]